MTETPAPDPGENIADDGGPVTSREKRRAEREARLAAKDAAYDLRQERKRTKDGTSLHGHHIVTTDVLADAFPDGETPELRPATVRRRIIHAVVLVLLLAMVVAGVVLAAMVQRGELDLKYISQKPVPTPVSCPGETLDYLDTKTVAVNVYNAGSVEGQAGKVAEQLKKRGFVVKEVANSVSEIAAPAVVISGPAGHAAALTVQRNFPGSDYVQDDRRGAIVDVVLTGKFEQLAPKVNTKPGALSCPRLSPPPSTPGPTPAKP